MINMSALKQNVSWFPFIFFNRSVFSISLNHISSQGVSSKDIYHGTVMIYYTKTISCTIRATYHARTTWISWKNKTQLSWQLWKKAVSSYCTTTRTQYVPTLKNNPYPPPPTPVQKSRIPTFFPSLNIPYPDRFSAFWLRLVSRPRATVKYHCTKYSRFFCEVRGRHRTVSAVCLFFREAITSVFWFRFW